MIFIVKYKYPYILLCMENQFMTAKILKEISEKIKEDYNSLEEIQKRKKNINRKCN